MEEENYLCKQLSMRFPGAMAWFGYALNFVRCGRIEFSRLSQQQVENLIVILDGLDRAGRLIFDDLTKVMKAASQLPHWQLMGVGPLLKEISKLMNDIQEIRVEIALLQVKLRRRSVH